MDAPGALMLLHRFQFVNSLPLRALVAQANICTPSARVPSRAMHARYPNTSVARPSTSTYSPLALSHSLTCMPDACREWKGRLYLVPYAALSMCINTTNVCI